MKKIATILFLIVLTITLLFGCGSSKNKTDLLDWMQSLNEDNAEIYFWTYAGEQQIAADMLFKDEIKTLTAIFAEISADELIHDKEPAKSSSMGYGLMVMVDGEKTYEKQHLIQAVLPDGEFQIYYKDKYWFIKNEELSNFILSFLENK